MLEGAFKEGKRMDEAGAAMSQNLPRLMRERGYSTGDLARAMDVSEVSANAWMTGRNLPRTNKLPALCEWLGCTPDDLLMRYSMQPIQPAEGVSMRLSLDECAVLTGYRETDDAHRRAVRNILNVGA